jgi:hypothetical protein
MCHFEVCVIGFSTLQCDPFPAIMTKAKMNYYLTEHSSANLTHLSSTSAVKPHSIFWNM